MWKEDFSKYLTDSTLDHSRVEEALDLKERHLPKRIYKFRSDCVYSRDNLKSNTVWVTSPDRYNDPYDCWLTFPEGEMVTLLGTRLGKTAEPNSAAISAIANQAASQLEDIKRAANLCSFSEANDSLLMCSHYADHHKGFCIEYDLEQLSKNHPFRRNLYPVSYGEQLYNLKRFQEGLVARGRQEFRPMLPLLGMLHKFEGWRYEDEWRLVFEEQSPIDGYAQPSPNPSHIFLGSRFDAAKSQELLEICRLKNAPISRMHLASDRFKLSPKRFTQ